MRAIDPFKVVAGTQEAEAFVKLLRTVPTDGDTLFHRLRQGFSNDDYMLGFCRRLTKYIETGR